MRYIQTPVKHIDRMQTSGGKCKVILLLFITESTHTLEQPRVESGVEKSQVRGLVNDGQASEGPG